MSSIENGRTKLSAEKLATLADALQIPAEEDASWIKSFDGQVVQGLLQIREYAEQIITASAPHLRVGDIDVPRANPCRHWPPLWPSRLFHHLE